MSTVGRRRGVALCVIVGAVVASDGRPLAQASGRPFSDAGEHDSPRISRLRRDIASANAARALTEFWTGVRAAGAPLIEPVAGEPEYSWVTFLWRAADPTTNVVVVDGVAAGLGGTDPTRSLLTPLGQTDVWYRTYKVRNDAAFTYTVSPNDTLEPLLERRRSRPQADPLNPNLSGPQSAVSLPSAPPRTERAADAAGPRGDVTATSITGAGSPIPRPLQVYTPPGFAGSPGNYPLLIVLDSGAYGDYVPVPAILDRLIDERRIAPTVAVMVGNLNRVEELSCSPAFAGFLARELVPWIRRTYRAGLSARTTVVSGASLGGLAASFAAFQHPEVFGNVVSQSGAYWWKPAQDTDSEWLTRRIAGEPARAVRLAVTVGAMEIPEQLDTNRRYRDALRRRGYDVSYSEFNGNHSYLNWRTDLPRHLVDLIGPPR